MLILPSLPVKSLGHFPFLHVNHFEEWEVTPNLIMTLETQIIMTLETEIPHILNKEYLLEVLRFLGLGYLQHLPLLINWIRPLGDFYALSNFF
jgi:hypothetical protein